MLAPYLCKSKGSRCCSAMPRKRGTIRESMLRAPPSKRMQNLHVSMFSAACLRNHCLNAGTPELRNGNRQRRYSSSYEHRASLNDCDTATSLSLSVGMSVCVRACARACVQPSLAPSIFHPPPGTCPSPLTPSSVQASKLHGIFRLTSRFNSSSLSV